jgi:hypothetical protein
MSANYATYAALDHRTKSLFANLAALSGDVVGPTGQSWQDQARIAALNARKLAHMLESAAAGDCEPMVCFPSPAEAVDSVYDLHAV